MILGAVFFGKAYRAQYVVENMLRMLRMKVVLPLLKMYILYLIYADQTLLRYKR